METYEIGVRQCQRLLFVRAIYKHHHSPDSSYLVYRQHRYAVGLFTILALPKRMKTEWKSKMNSAKCPSYHSTLSECGDR